MIRQFDVVDNPIRSARIERPYLMAIQHDRLSDLSTRVLLPLVLAKVVAERSRLTPSVTIRGAEYFVDPTNIVTLPIRQLGHPVANLAPARDRIVAALDLVFTGI